MIVNVTSIETTLATIATNRSNVQVQAQITMAVLKQMQDFQEIQAAGLLKMINNTSLDGTGQLVNRTA